MKTVHLYTCVSKNTCAPYSYHLCRICAHIAKSDIPQFNPNTHNVSNVLSDLTCQGCQGCYVKNIYSGKLTQSRQ